MDIHHKLSYHLVVASMSILLTASFWSLFNISLGRSVAATAFILLFLTLVMGPLMKLWKPALRALPWNLPWSWRGELGIWFTIFSIIHILLVFQANQWDIAGYLTNLRLSGLVGFIAIFMAIILAAASFNKVVTFLGISSWKWLQSFAYVIFYLTACHIINHAFLRPGRPEDWLHWFYLVAMIIIVVLQSMAFIKTTADYRQHRNK